MVSVAVLEAGAVLLAPGREGSPWMERTVASLGLEIKSLPVDIGVRVEIPAGIAEAVTDQFYEVKAILDTPTFDDQVRTFCMCPYGEVTTEYMEQHDILTVNGHSNRGGDGRTGNTNFAILVSTDFTEPFKDPNGYGSHIARLANMLGGGVLVQRLGDLKQGRRSTPGRIARGLVEPTLKTAEPGDLSFVLPYRHLKGILEMIQALDVIMPGMDGPTWVREALKERPNTRVVFVSGYSEEHLTETRERVPNSVFLPKPFSLSELTATVQGQIH